MALKRIKIKSYSDGVHFSALREIRHLQELYHKNVIALHETFAHEGSIYLVLEYCDAGDLEDFLRNRNIKITAAHVRYLMRRVTLGLLHMHNEWVLHRDVKPNNILLTASGGVKLADFGYARSFGEPGRLMTSQAVTRWYRPPELLFGATAYGAAVDMWSLGCLFFELLFRVRNENYRAYFPGESDTGQLTAIFQQRGTPTKEDWPMHESLPNFMSIIDSHAQAPYPRRSAEGFGFSASAISMLDSMLEYNPLKRASAKEVLDHDYFFQHSAGVHSSGVWPRVHRGRERAQPSHCPPLTAPTQGALRHQHLPIWR